jgi:hypothetical protein
MKYDERNKVNGGDVKDTQPNHVQKLDTGIGKENQESMGKVRVSQTPHV